MPGGADDDRVAEDFALISCPHCGQVHLICYEDDVVYPDPDDLSVRVYGYTEFTCPGCRRRPPAGTSWTPATWRAVARSGWTWTIKPTRRDGL